MRLKVLAAERETTVQALGLEALCYAAGPLLLIA